MKGDKLREKKAPKWVNEEVPVTEDGLRLYIDYAKDEIKHCRSVLKRLETACYEAQRRLGVIEGQRKAEERGWA